MSALDTAKTMGREAVLAKMEELALQEYGLIGGSLKALFDAAQAECEESGLEPGVVAALNNADVDGVLLEVLKEEPEQVMAGIAAAAFAAGGEKKCLHLPEYAADLAENEAIRSAAEKYEISLVSGIINKRADKGCVMMHIVSAKQLADALDGTYEAGVYVSVNGGKLEKVSADKKVSEVAELEGAKALQIGYRYYTPEAGDMTLAEAGVENGVIKVLAEKDCIVSETEKRLVACRKQSCGKCVFCREGLLQLQYMNKEITEGRGKGEFVELTKEIGDAMIYSTPCTMGQVSSKIALSAVDLFEKEYQSHIKKKKCPAGVCFSEEILYIDPQLCEGCEECADACPLDCIEGKSGYIHMIDDISCDKCGKCIEVCEVGAVKKAEGKLPKLPNRLTKVGRFKKRR